MKYKNYSAMFAVLFVVAGIGSGCEYYTEKDLLPPPSINAPVPSEGQAEDADQIFVLQGQIKELQDKLAEAEASPQPSDDSGEIDSLKAMIEELKKQIEDLKNKPAEQPVVDDESEEAPQGEQPPVDAGGEDEVDQPASDGPTVTLNPGAIVAIKPAQPTIPNLNLSFIKDLDVESVTFDPYGEKVTVTFNEEIDFGALLDLDSARLWEHLKNPSSFCDEKSPWKLHGESPLDIPCESDIDQTGKIWPVDATTIRINAGKMSAKATVTLVLTGADENKNRAIRDLDGHLMQKTRRYTIVRNCGYKTVQDFFDDNRTCDGSVTPVESQ